MKENMLLRTVVEDELRIYESRFGKAVCRQAKKLYNRKRIKEAFKCLVMVILIVAFVRLVGTASQYAYGIMFAWLAVIALVYVINNKELMKNLFHGGYNPIVYYVSVLAKKNPDTKIRHIIFTVCENTSTVSNSYGMNGYGTNGYGTNGYGMDGYARVALVGVETSAQSLFKGMLAIVCTIFLAVGILGIGGYYLIPHVSYTQVSDGYMVKNFKQGFSLEGNAVIPEKYEGIPVVAIDSRAFRGDPFIRTVELPSFICRIGGEAFKNCRNLESIRIPDKVTELRGNTFEGCRSLYNIELPDGIVEIHGECFKNCKKLQKIDLPPDITEIKGNTFEGCTSLYRIDIPEGVTRIGGHAFYGCSNLMDVRVPVSVEYIGSSAFRKCSSLTNIELPAGISVNERAFKESPTSISFYESN